MTDQTALAILATIKNELGRTYKAVIRQAWMSGDYSEGLEKWACDLQRMRNALGPSWLINAQPSAAKPAPGLRVGAYVAQGETEPGLLVMAGGVAVSPLYRPDDTGYRLLLEALNGWDPDWLFGTTPRRLPQPRGQHVKAA